MASHGDDDERQKGAYMEVEMQAIQDYRNFAALTIQRYYRGWIVRLHHARQEASRLQQEETAAAQQAQAARFYKAARTIQDSWRSFHNRRIYRFYRDTIKTREACSPQQMLRCINAPEAALVEPAAGLHVRFRLGGSSFPPIMLYKIFTSRSVTDICAFGPRDYAQEAAISKPTGAAAAVPSAGASAGAATGPAGSSSSRGSRKGWYCRDDRNGWRPVLELQQYHGDHSNCWSGSTGRTTSKSSRRHSYRLHSRRRVKARSMRSQQSEGQPGGAEGYCSEPELVSNQHAAGLQASSSTGSAQVFHYSPLVRRLERVQRLKQRRRQWLLKMYRLGKQAATAPVCTEGDPSCLEPEAGSDSPHPGLQLQHSPQQPNAEEGLLQELEQQLLCRPTSSITVGSAGVVAGDADLDIGVDVGELVACGLEAGILSWAQTLDFDSYQQQWLATAVTLSSEAAVPKDEHLLRAMHGL